jgi:hypothetical protein
MPAARHPQRKSVRLWPPVATVVVALIVIFAWTVFRKDQPVVPQVATDVPVAKPLPDEGTRPTAESNGTNQPATYADTLGMLQGKLQGSKSDFLASLAGMAKDKPGEAIDLALALGAPEEEKSTWITDIMKKWAGSDPLSAWQWLQQQGNRMDQLANGSLTGVVFGAMAARDPGMLLATMNSLLSPSNTTGPFASETVVRAGLQALVDSGNLDLARQAVETWTSSPLKPDIGAAAYETVAIALGKSAPEEAGAWLETLPDTPVTGSAVTTFALDWSKRDPAGAMAWAETLPPDESQASAINSIFGNWAAQDPTAAGEWLNNYFSRTSPSPDNDTQVEALIFRSSALQNNPALALQWASLISDPTEQAASEESVIKRWASNDRAAATDYVNESPAFTTDQKQALLQELQAGQ